LLYSFVRYAFAALSSPKASVDGSKTMVRPRWCEICPRWQIVVLSRPTSISAFGCSLLFNASRKCFSCERPVLAEAAQFPDEHEVAVIVRYHLCVGTLLRVVEPVNAAVARYSFRQTIVHASHRLDAPHGEVEHVY